MGFDLSGHRLLLAGSRDGWSWLAAGLVAVGLLLMLYRAERQLVSPRAGLGLLGLRVLAALVLVGALFEPIAHRTWRESVRGRVIVAVDDSASMTTIDPGSPGAASRRAVARSLIDGPKAPLAPLAADHDVIALSFARAATPGSPLPALAESLRRPPPVDGPDRFATDFDPPLASALTSSGSDAPVLGVVLVTDGRSNGVAPAGTPVADRLAAREVPVFPVLVGSTTPPPDAAVAALRGPERVNRGEVALVSATLKLDGVAPGSAVDVALDRAGAEPIIQAVRVPDGGARPVATFRVPLDEVGDTRLTVRVPAAPGDARPDNDHKAIVVRVGDDKARVLLVDGSARWEFQYLRNALARDPRVAVDAVVFHQPTTPSLAVPAYPTAWPGLDPTGRAADPLNAYDAIVIGDIPPSDLPADVWSRLDRYVAGRGGTLVLLPGPRLLASLGDDLPRAILPVVDPRPVPVDPGQTDPTHPSLPAGVVVHPAPLALGAPDAWPMLQLGDGPEASRSAWAALPHLPWAVAGRAKPTATPLLLAGTSLGDEGVLAAAQPYGLGKVLWVGTDGTWRWRYRVGDALHHRFWGQVVRWSGADPLAVGNRVVRHGPTRPQADQGEPITLRARVADDVAGLPEVPLIAARIVRLDNPDAPAVAVVPLRPVAGRPRVFEGVAPPLPEGGYRVRLDAPELAAASVERGAGPIPEAPLEVIARDTTETIELAASRDGLDRLAGATGGQVVLARDAAQILPLIAARSRPVERSEDVPLWDHPVTLLLFFAILTVEWVARKRLGLP